MRKKTPPVDYFGHLVEIGDRFFCGNPCAAGEVIKIMGKSIMLQVDHNCTMNFKSPEKGVCLDKVPTRSTTQCEYKVEWRMWKGTDLSGMSEYSNHSQLFDDKTEAYAYFEAKLLSDDQVKLTRVTTDQLEASDEH
tara:strand:- start:151 stop:558 length:408 start_codon:yes stop_codon:yes gene_type:complete